MTLSRTQEKLLARLGHRKAREREGLFLVEGIRSVAEALSAAADISFGLVAPRASELAGGPAVLLELEAAGVELHSVGDADLGTYADTEVNQGLLLVCREPVFALEDLIAATLSGPGVREPTTRLLVLDRIQDPGNAGTLLRAAAAFGLQGVVFLEGSVDPYNAKVVRASPSARNPPHPNRFRYH
jgi:TrmH family RNA methyltransferase